MVEFTGNKRYREHKRLFRKSLVVLQLEVKGFVPEYPCGGDYRTWWEDARIEDITDNRYKK